jgi:Nitrate and nitrite sensing/Histidine kinase-, DNA gyrase B-, and HSP90-like ATPase
MAARRPSVRVRVSLLALVPLIFLVGIFGYLAATSASTVLALTRSKVMMDDLAGPVAGLQRALAAERSQAAAYYAHPDGIRLAALESQEAQTDRAVTAFQAVAASAAVRRSAAPAGQKAITGLLSAVAGLTALRPEIPGRKVSPRQLFGAYGNTIAASYQVVEQAIIQEGNSAQVLPGIAIIELAVSDEFLQQESALLNGDFAARAFPAADHRDFVSLVGAHRLLYAQCLPYLTKADLRSLHRNVSPAVAGALTAMEDAVVADGSPKAPPPVRPASWNATVTAYNAQVQRAVGEAEARFAAGARSQAGAKLRMLLVTSGVGLAGVILTVVFSLSMAAGLARQLSGLRDSALDLADRQLPAVVRRLRAGQDVDIAAEVPPLQPEADEIGQVKAAFNAARRTAVEAAVDEAKLRRSVSDVFRNLAKRSQSLLHRQMALLDALERRENNPDNLQGLFRIDHLTTRMRRHAENLVILAGDAPKRGWRSPVPFVDVLRAAAAEVEDYTRIKVICTTPGALAGHAVADVIHLVAELAENATLFSPQHTQVRMTGELVARGFAVDIEDRGLGLTGDELAELNQRLANPPEFDLAGSEQLGIFVAGRLARRHGIAVSLTDSPYGGVTAVVLIPMDLVADTEDQSPAAARPLSPGGRHALTGLDGSAVGSTPGDEPPGPATLTPPAWLAGDTAAAPVPVGSTDATPPTGIPVMADPAGSVLPQRVRQANLPPQLRGQAAGQPAAGTGQPLRDPEVARTVMAAFQQGWSKGIAEPGGAAETGPGDAAEEGGQET